MEEVTKCRYIDCFDGQEKEQILHELPICDTSLCVKWLINSGHVDLIGKDLDALRSMKFFICNNHFTEDCYLSKGTLKENAVPSPHWSTTVSRTLKTSKIRQKNQDNSQEHSMEICSMNSVTEKTCLSEFEVDQWCRTCATKKHNLVSMTTKGKGTEMSLLSKLKLLIEIDDEDALPTKMCDECVVKLEQSFKFFQQIYIADNTLRHVFPNTRTSNLPRKPLHSLSEHLRKEQKEREREKEKEKEKEREEDRAARVTRGGVFRRGRGRPRTRGYAGRARGRQRASQIPASFPSPDQNENTVASRICDSSVNVSTVLKDQQTLTVEEERRGDTVFSLLMDTCRSDEELDWSDVLKLMNHQEGEVSERADSLEALPAPTEPEQQQEQQQEKLQDKQQQQQEVKEEIAKVLVTATEAETSQLAEPERKEVAAMKAEKAAAFSQTEAEEKNSKIQAEDRSEIKEKKEKKEKETGPTCCEFCKETFKHKRELQTHLLNEHSQSSVHMCTDCLVCYESESLLSKHRSLRHGNRRYRCEHCQEEFSEKRVLREHVRKCQSDTINLCYSCDSCGLALDSKQLLIEHLKCHPASLNASAFLQSNPDQANSRSEQRSKIEMEQEQDQFVATTSLNSTFITSESKLDEANTRLNCALDSTNSEEQGKHEGESMICPDCDEKVENEVVLSIHRMRRHSVKRKDAACLLCENKIFTSSEEYERHVLDHCKRLRVSP